MYLDSAIQAKKNADRDDPSKLKLENVDFLQVQVMNGTNCPQNTLGLARPPTENDLNLPRALNNLNKVEQMSVTLVLYTDGSYEKLIVG